MLCYVYGVIVITIITILEVPFAAAGEMIQLRLVGEAPLAGHALSGLDDSLRGASKFKAQCNT